MSAYLKFFQLEKSPFDTQAQSNLVLGTKALRSAFAEIEAGLADGAARICVDGKAGLGKTSLARALPKLLGDRARVVLILNPSLPWNTLRAAIVKQLDLAEGNLSRKTLMRARSEGRKLVVVVDQAERISSESLEHLDILIGYKNDADEQLLHCVLLANLAEAATADTDRGEPCPLLWWLDRLNTLQLEFHPIPPNGVDSYIQKHLKRAGWKGGRLFTPEAMQTIHRLTGGVPREMSELCERALELAAEQQTTRVDVDMVEACFGEIPLDDLLENSLFSTECDPGISTDDRSEFERSRPAPAEGRRPPSTGPAEEDGDGDPRIDRMPGAARRAARRADEAPLSLDSFFGDSTPSSPAASSPARPAAVAAAPAETITRPSPDASASEAFEEHEEPSSHTGGGWIRKLALAAAVALTLGLGGLAAMFVFAGASDDGTALGARPAVLARPKPAPAPEPAPVAGIEPAFNVEAPAEPLGVEPQWQADAALDAGNASKTPGPTLPPAVAERSLPPLRVIDRGSDEPPDMMDDLEQALGGPAAPSAAAAAGADTDAAEGTEATGPDASSAPAAPAPTAGWRNPAEVQVEEPYW